MRQLVTVRTVKEILPIQGADNIELAKINGWQCVVKKGDFQVGDIGLYFEIDSVLPSDDERFAFLEPRKFRVKTMKLRGTLSQGLLMPFSILTSEENVSWLSGTKDLQDVLGVQKYEPPVPISGKQVGSFPSYLFPKTDQERIQNIPQELEGKTNRDFEITEKLDGTSCTMFYYKAPDNPSTVRMGVCSRNWEMSIEDDNVYAKMFVENNMLDKFIGLDRSIAIQGEIIGPGIQGNKYKRAKQEFYVFDIYDTDNQKYVTSAERMGLCAKLGLLHVPTPSFFELFKNVKRAQPLQQGTEAFNLDLDLVLELADGKSMLGDVSREGLVFKHLTRPLVRFKVISNKFLLKHD